MTDHVLTLNAGSSSIKFALFEAKPHGDPREKARGQIEGIGGQARLKARTAASEDAIATDFAPEGGADHAAALNRILDFIEDRFDGIRVAGVGHRIVHGGTAFGAPVRLDAAVITELERLSPFAPLHQPHNLAGVRGAEAAFPAAVQVGCFDTAFHRSHPWVNDTFALPRAYYDKGVRRYGFHGLSYDYVCGAFADRAPELADGGVIIAHLGNGASMCAVRHGRSVGSTMGFSALDGLPMGTRCGQLDPGVLLYLMEQEGMDAATISHLLYHDCGLKGLSGLSNDMRELETAGTPEADQAIEYFVFRCRREIGALTATLEGLDALVFTGGIGENAWRVRADICAGLGWLGVALDDVRNQANASVVSADHSALPVHVVRTNEELTIARGTFGRLADSPADL